MTPPHHRDSGEPKLVALDRPRDLSSAERALLAAIVDGIGPGELSGQVARAKVIAECSCGCPSIGLHTDGPVVIPDVLRRLSPVGRDDVLDVTAYATNRKGREVEITLHIVFGRLEELEIWAGTFGGDPRTEVPSPESLRFE